MQGKLEALQARMLEPTLVEDERRAANAAFAAASSEAQRLRAALDAAEAARDGVAAPFDRLVARARVVVADEQKKCARHAAPRGNVPWLRRERTESQLARAEAVEEELRERKRGALREHVAFCEDMRDGVHAAEHLKRSRPRGCLLYTSPSPRDRG